MTGATRSVATRCRSRGGAAVLPTRAESPGGSRTPGTRPDRARDNYGWCGDGSCQHLRGHDTPGLDVPDQSRSCARLHCQRPGDPWPRHRRQGRDHRARRAGDHRRSRRGWLRATDQGRPTQSLRDRARPAATPPGRTAPSRRRAPRRRRRSSRARRRRGTHAPAGPSPRRPKRDDVSARALVSSARCAAQLRAAQLRASARSAA